MTSIAKRTATTLGATAAAIAVVAIAGGAINRSLQMHLNAAPLYGQWSPRLGPGLALAAVLAALIVWKVDVFDRLPWKTLLAACAAGAAIWGVGLALVDGRAGLTMGITGPHEHLAILDTMPGAEEFVRTFVERIADYNVHVRGHPPGVQVGVLWLHRLGFATPAALATILIGAGASSVIGVLIAAREVAGEYAARRAAPFLVLAPAAIWMVTSVDALYAALGTWAVALLVLATGQVGPRRVGFALAGGTVLAAGLFASYGFVPIGLIPIAVALKRRRFDVLAIGAVPVVAALAAFAAAGFWWVDGLAATRQEYALGISGVRPYGYFIVANLAVAAIAVGPAAVAGLERARRNALWPLVGAAAAAILVADLSGLSKGEVERIWLPFFPWLALSAAIAADRPRRWLAAQAVVVISMQSTILFPW